nr:AMP-binding protein [Streptomyces sp. SID8354]
MDPERGIHFARGRDGWEFHSYAALSARAHAVAGALRDRGGAPGRTVALLHRTGPDFVAGLLGCLLAGAVPAPLAPPPLGHPEALYARRLRQLLIASGAVLTLADASLSPLLSPDHPALTTSELTATPGPVPLEPARPAGLLQFTSGSSGPPRPVRIPYEALCANIAAIGDWLGLGESDVTASWLPLHHDMGLTGCLLTPVAYGHDIFLMSPEQFLRDPLRYLRCFDEGGATVSSTPAFGLAHLLRRLTPQHLAGLDLSWLRALIVGAERVSPALLDRVTALLAPHGLRRGTLLPAYGLAEATLAVTGVRPGHSWTTRAEPPGDAPAVVSCGPPVSGVRVSVLGEDGAELPEDIVGEIAVRGGSVAHQGPEALRTGDAGFLHGGELHILGRLGDGLKVRGRMVFAEALEEQLAAAGVPHRRTAALLGVHRGRATAVVLLDRQHPGWVDTAHTLLRRELPDADRVVLSVPVGVLSRTTSGKPRRRPLWHDYCEGRLPGEPLAPPAPPTSPALHPVRGGTR